MTEPVPAGIRLEGDAASAYVSAHQAVLRAARLNSQFTDSRRLSAHVGALSPDCHRGLHPHLEVRTDSGLPTYAMWVRVQSDVRLAGKILADLGDPAALEARASQGSAPHQKQLQKVQYYRQIETLDLTPIGQMSVALKRVDPTTQTAEFRVVLDKFDVTGTFVRFSIDLRQHNSVWSKPMVHLDDDRARHTKDLEAVIYRLTSRDAEVAFVELATSPGIRVQRLVKGSVGPFFWTGINAEQAPSGVVPLLDSPSGVVASFSCEIAACDQPEVPDNDPWIDHLATPMSDATHAAYRDARARFGYRVWRDRKFVVSQHLLDRFRTQLGGLGMRNIVYPVSIAPTGGRS